MVGLLKVYFPEKKRTILKTLILFSCTGKSSKTHLHPINNPFNSKPQPKECGMQLDQGIPSMCTGLAATDCKKIAFLGYKTDEQPFWQKLFYQCTHF